MRKIDYRARRSMHVVHTYGGYPVRFAWFQSRNTLTSRYIEARIKKTDALCGRTYSSAIDSILCFPAFRADTPFFARWTKNNKQPKTHHHLWQSPPSCIFERLTRWQEVATRDPRVLNASYVLELQHRDDKIIKKSVTLLWLGYKDYSVNLI